LCLPLNNDDAYAPGYAEVGLDRSGRIDPLRFIMNMQISNLKQHTSPPSILDINIPYILANKLRNYNNYADKKHEKLYRFHTSALPLSNSISSASGILYVIGFIYLNAGGAAIAAIYIHGKA
ncbi:hypothetical protein ACFLTS_02810, partial [Chloroflexota bacterium]